MTLKEYLKNKSLTVQQFADLSGIPYQTVYKYLNQERRPRGGNLQKIKQVTDGLVTADCFY